MSARMTLKVAIATALFPAIALAANSAKEKAATSAAFAKLAAKVEAAKADAAKNGRAFGGSECFGYADDFASFGKSHNAPEGYFNAGVLYENCGDANKALNAYRSALGVNPNFAPAHVNIGELAYKKGDMSTAQEEFDAALKADPKNVQAYNDTALMLVERAKLEEGDQLYKDAIGKLRRALALDATSMPAYSMLALIYYTVAASDRSKLDLAELVCKQAKEVNDKYPPIYNILGLIKLKKKNVTGALKEFRTAAELDPHYIEAQLNIGAITLSARDYVSAEKAFKATLDAKPTDAKQLFDATLGMGVALRGQKRVDEAEQWYDKAKQLDPRNCAVSYDLGVLYQDYKTSEDNSHLNKAKSLFQEFVSCGRADKDKLDDARRRMKDVDDTFKALAEAKKLEEENKKLQEEAERMQKQQEEQLKKQQEEEAAKAGKGDKVDKASVAPAEDKGKK